MMRLSVLNSYWIVIFMMFSLSSLCFSQKDISNDVLVKKYPDQAEVIVHDHTEYKIKSKNDRLVISSSNYKEHAILNSSGINSVKNSFYSSMLTPTKLEKAYTLTNKRKKIDASLVQKKDQGNGSVFYDDVWVNLLTYPNIEPGARKILETKTNYKDPNLLNMFVFKNYTWMDNASLTVEVDKGIELGYSLFNDNQNTIAYSKDVKRNKVIHKWEAHNIKPLKHKRNQQNYLYYVPHVVIYVKDSELADQLYHLGSSDKLYQYYRQFISSINKEIDVDLIELADSITAKYELEREKVKAIFDWVCGHVKYVAYEDGYGGFIPREANKIYDRRFGDCKDMASIITAMSNAVGVDSVYMSWIGTRDLPYTYEELPTPASCNHMIATYIDEGVPIFMDATSPESIFGMPSSFIQGKEAMIGISDSNFVIQKVPVVSYDDNTYKYKLKLGVKDKTLNGSGVLSINGLLMTNFLNQLNSYSAKDQNDYVKGVLKLGNNKFDLLNYELSDHEIKDSAFTIEYDFDIDNYIVVFNDSYYVSLFLRDLYDLDLIDSERLTKYAFQNLYSIENNVELSIPEGYKCSYLPEPIQVDNDLLNFKAEYNLVDQNVVLDYCLKLKKLVLNPEDYTLWNDSVKDIKDYMKETIEIKK